VSNDVLLPMVSISSKIKKKVKENIAIKKLRLDILKTAAHSSVIAFPTVVVLDVSRAYYIPNLTKQKGSKVTFSDYLAYERKKLCAVLILEI
jgi:hypothetical protein